MIPEQEPFCFTSGSPEQPPGEWPTLCQDKGDLSAMRVAGKWASQKACLACSLPPPFFLAEMFFWPLPVMAVLKVFGLRTFLPS